MNNIKLIIAGILILLSLSAPIQASAQDTNYMRKYDYMLYLKGINYVDGFRFKESGTDYRYIPDVHAGIGGAFLLKYFPLEIRLQRELTSLSRIKGHRAKTSDMQFRFYNRFVCGDLYIQKYKGFYAVPDGQRRPVMDDECYNPDLSVNRVDLVVHYIFNNSRFYYKAGFTGNGRQLISAGSPTVGAAVYYMNVEGGSLGLDEDGKSSVSSYNYGLNAGYAYNFVFGDCGTLFLSGSVGANINNDFDVSPSCHLKGAYWIHHGNWSWGYSSTYNIIHQTFDGRGTLRQNTFRNEILAVRRLFVNK